MVTMTIELDHLEQLECCRCGRTAHIQPMELRKGVDPTKPELWRVTCWNPAPMGWRRFEWLSGERSSACAECWPEVERRGRAFLAELRSDAGANETSGEIHGRRRR